MQKDDFSVIYKGDWMRILKMMLDDRLALVRQRVAARLDELQTRHTFFETTDDPRVTFIETAGYEREVFSREEFRSLMGMTSLDPKELGLTIGDIIDEEGIQLPEGFAVVHKSEGWSSRDDGGTDHTLVLELAPVDALV